MPPDAGFRASGLGTTRFSAASDSERAELAAGAGALPDRVEMRAQLAGAGAAVEPGLAVVAVAQRPVVPTVEVVDQIGRGVFEVDRLFDGAEFEHARQTLAQPDQG